MKKILTIVVVLTALFLPSLTVFAAPDWQPVTVSLATSSSLGFMGISDVSFYTPSYDFSGSMSVSNSGMKIDPSTGKVSWTSLNINSNTLGIYANCYPAFSGPFYGQFRTGVLEPGTYYGTISFSCSFDFYSSTDKRWRSLFLDSLYLNVDGHIYQGVIQNNSVTFRFGDIYHSRRGPMDITFSGSAFFLSSSKVPELSFNDDLFRVNSSLSIIEQNVFYHPGDVNTPGNVDDFNADQTDFDNTLSSGQALSSDLTSTAFDNVGSASNEYFVAPAAQVLSGAAFYTACVTGLYNNLGDFKYILLVCITFIILRFIFRKVKGG